MAADRIVEVREGRDELLEKVYDPPGGETGGGGESRGESAS